MIATENMISHLHCISCSQHEDRRIPSCPCRMSWARRRLEYFCHKQKVTNEDVLIRTHFPIFLILSLASGGISSSSSLCNTPTHHNYRALCMWHYSTTAETHTAIGNVNRSWIINITEYITCAMCKRDGIQVEFQLTSFPNTWDTSAGFLASGLGFLGSGAAYIGG